MNECMYVCMYVRTYVYIHIYMYIYIYTRILYIYIYDTPLCTYQICMFIGTCSVFRYIWITFFRHHFSTTWGGATDQILRLLFGLSGGIFFSLKYICAIVSKGYIYISYIYICNQLTKMEETTKNPPKKICLKSKVLFFDFTEKS